MVRCERNLLFLNSFVPFLNLPRTSCNYMKTVTKRDLVMEISNELGMTQRDVFNVMQSFIGQVTTNLSNGDEVVLRNFGTFQVMETKAKVGRNPRDPGKEVTIPPRAVVKFRPGKEMKEKVAKLLPNLHKGRKSKG